jgi:polysaccharide biosynthesis transport protein
MAAPAQLGVYFAVLRKHLALLTISAALVVAAGVFYVVRQEPVFLSSATLVIETPPRSAASGGAYNELLAQEQDDLNTQVYLLKRSRKLAAAAVEKLKAAGVDVASGEYTDETLPARVKVEPIPGTRAWSFSLTGPDAASLPTAVNAYAEVFHDWSEGKSERTYEMQVKQFNGIVEEEKARLQALQSEQNSLVEENKDLDFTSAESVDAVALLALERELPGLELRRDGDLAQRAQILGALQKAEVGAVRTDAGYALSLAVEGDTVVERLVDDARVAALACVEQSPVVKERLRREHAAQDRDLELKKQDLKEDTPARRAAQREVHEARLERGKAIVGVIESELAGIDARVAQFERSTSRAHTLRETTKEQRAIKHRFEKKRAEVDEQRRVVDQAYANLKAFQNTYLPELPGAGASSERRATRRVDITMPAATAEQIAPKVPLIIGLTAFAALAVGLGLVLLFEYLDDTVKSKEDFDRYVALPFLGFIPRIDAKEAANPDLAADARSGSAIAEAFRAVRTSILFSRSGKPVRSILVTSAGPGEGKTTVASNLAVTLAKHKGPVLLVDADLRRPRVAKALGVENKIGLTNYLIGEATLDDIVRPTSVAGLFVVTSGPIPPNPAELLHGDKLAQLLASALERYDRVVIDSPPIIAVSDARVIARCTDGLYLVISMGRTSWRVIQRSVESLTSIGAEVHGAILNNLAAPTGRYGYYYYRDYEVGKGDYLDAAAEPER